MKRVDGRGKLLKKIVETFEDLNPVAIHQFGSGASGYKDEFSDLDLWITFKKEKIDEVLKQQEKIFRKIAPVLIEHHSKKNSPVGGGATLVIYSLPEGLFQVDFYFATEKFPKGEWKLSPEVDERKTLRKDLTYLIVMGFILIKGIIRLWGKSEAMETVRKVYKRVEEKSGMKFAPLPEDLNFGFITTLLENIRPLASREQQKAISSIENFAQQIKSSL